jgi:hypothetical protein
MDLATLTLRDLTAGFNHSTDNIQCLNTAYPSKATLRRCRTREQGIALLTVSHAIEYLLDSRLMKEENTSNAEREALAILLSANLSIYNEGAEIVPLGTRFRQWFRGGAAKNNIANLTA